MSNIRAWVDDHFGCHPKEYEFDEGKRVLMFCDNYRWKGLTIKLVDGHYAVFPKKSDTQAAGTYESQKQVINEILIPMCGEPYKNV